MSLMRYFSLAITLSRPGHSAQWLSFLSEAFFGHFELHKPWWGFVVLEIYEFRLCNGFGHPNLERKGESNLSTLVDSLIFLKLREPQTDKTCFELQYPNLWLTALLIEPLFHNCFEMYSLFSNQTFTDKWKSPLWMVLPPYLVFMFPLTKQKILKWFWNWYLWMTCLR